MPESAMYFVGVLIAAFTTALIAFPDHLVPDFESKRKKKKYGARHWGSYKDTKIKELKQNEEEEGIEVGIPAKKGCYTIGSSTYAGGRGTR